ncbi:MAG: porin family protein [Ginsengibacter sp.]
MKKTIVLGVAVLFAFGANAQVEAHFGLKGGLNASELHSKDVKADTKIGFHVGGLAHIHGNSNWAFQPEVMYSLEGAKYKTPLGTLNRNLSFINVPLLAQYMFDNGFRIEAGPQIGFLMSAKDKIDNSNPDIKGQFKSTAVSLPVGVGYLTRSGLGFDARYNFGLTDLNKDGQSVKGNNFQFGIFWQFSDPKIKK